MALTLDEQKAANEEIVALCKQYKEKGGSKEFVVEMIKPLIKFSQVAKKNVTNDAIAAIKTLLLHDVSSKQVPLIGYYFAYSDIYLTFSNAINQEQLPNLCPLHIFYNALQLASIDLEKEFNREEKLSQTTAKTCPVIGLHYLPLSAKLANHGEIEKHILVLQDMFVSYPKLIKIRDKTFLFGIVRAFILFYVLNPKADISHVTLLKNICDYARKKGVSLGVVYAEVEDECSLDQESLLKPLLLKPSEDSKDELLAALGSGNLQYAVSMVRHCATLVANSKDLQQKVIDIFKVSREKNKELLEALIQAAPGASILVYSTLLSEVKTGRGALKLLAFLHDNQVPLTGVLEFKLLQSVLANILAIKHQEIDFNFTELVTLIKVLNNHSQFLMQKDNESLRTRFIEFLGLVKVAILNPKSVKPFLQLLQEPENYQSGFLEFDPPAKSHKDSKEEKTAESARPLQTLAKLMGGSSEPFVYAGVKGRERIQDIVAADNVYWLDALTLGWKVEGDDILSYLRELEAFRGDLNELKPNQFATYEQMKKRFAAGAQESGLDAVQKAILLAEVTKPELFKDLLATTSLQKNIMTWVSQLQMSGESFSRLSSRVWNTKKVSEWQRDGVVVYSACIELLAEEQNFVPAIQVMSQLWLPYVKANTDKLPALFSACVKKKASVLIALLMPHLVPMINNHKLLLDKATLEELVQAMPERGLPQDKPDFKTLVDLMQPAMTTLYHAEDIAALMAAQSSKAYLYEPLLTPSNIKAVLSALIRTKDFDSASRMPGLVALIIRMQPSPKWHTYEPLHMVELSIELLSGEKPYTSPTYALQILCLPYLKDHAEALSAYVAAIIKSKAYALLKAITPPMQVDDKLYVDAVLEEKAFDFQKLQDLAKGLKFHEHLSEASELAIFAFAKAQFASAPDYLLEMLSLCYEILQGERLKEIFNLAQQHKNQAVLDWLATLNGALSSGMESAADSATSFAEAKTQLGRFKVADLQKHAAPKMADALLNLAFGEEKSADILVDLMQIVEYGSQASPEKQVAFFKQALGKLNQIDLAKASDDTLNQVAKIMHFLKPEVTADQYKAPEVNRIILELDHRAEDKRVYKGRFFAKLGYTRSQKMIAMIHLLNNYLLAQEPVKSLVKEERKCLNQWFSKTRKMMKDISKLPKQTLSSSVEMTNR